MAVLTPAQIASYAYQAGFRGSDLVLAVAVAVRESGGNTQAYNPETAAGTRPGAGSRGLWQIYGSAHPEFNNDSVYDPAANARAAFKVYREAGGSFRPWSTYNNGSASSLALSLGNLKVRRGSGPAASSPAAGSGSRPAVNIPAIGNGSALAGVGAAVVGSAASAPAAVITEAGNNIVDNIGLKLLGTNAQGQPREAADAIGFIAGGSLILLGLIVIFFKSGAAEATGKAAVTVVKAAL